MPVMLATSFSYLDFATNSIQIHLSCPAVLTFTWLRTIIKMIDTIRDWLRQFDNKSGLRNNLVKVGGGS